MDPPASQPVRPALPSRAPSHSQVVGLLGGAVLLAGLLPSLAVLGVPRLAGLERLWRAAFGVLAIPIAFSLTAAGSALYSRRAGDPWRLPWGRAIAVEGMAFSALALMALAAAPDAVPRGGAGGRVGWALASVTVEAVGRIPAVGIWLALGVLSTLWAFRVGAQTLSGWLGGNGAAPDDRGDRPGPSADASQAGASPASRAGSVPAAGRASPVQRPMGDPPATRADAGPARGQPSRIITGSPGIGTGTGTGTGTAATRAGARAPSSGQPSSAPHAPLGPASTPSATPQVPASPPPTTTKASASPPPAAARASGSPLPTGPKAATPAAPRAQPVRRRPPTVRRVAGQPTSARRVARSGALPEVALLGEDAPGGPDAEALRAMAARLEETLAALGAPVDVTDIEHGPTVVRFLVVPGTVERAGERRRVPLARITAVRNDLALALAVPALRIEAPVAGRPVVGIEVPSPEGQAVSLRGLLVDRAFRRVAERSGLALAVGRAVSGAPIVGDLERLPHLLVAGATGSGKSVGLAALLASLLFQNTPDALRLVLVDPKRVELTRFAKLPHLLAPIVTDVVEVAGVLLWLGQEMDRRYQAFAEAGARDLRAFNRKLPPGTEPLPRLVIVIDELADVILRAPSEVEPLLVRLAQMARATGIHLIVATQRPSVDVVTGLIKANIPARLAFAVASAGDSRVVLDAPGAEALLGRGDLLFQPPDAPQPLRGQGALVADDELDRLVAFWAGSAWPAPPRLAPWVDLIPPDDPEEALYDRAIEVALAEPSVSASLLQRRLGIGFPKARALYDRLRREGVLQPDDWTPPDPGAGEPSAPAGDDDPPSRPRRSGLDWVDDEFGG